MTCPTDPNSFANVHEIVVKHTHLTLTADFDRRILRGQVVHHARTVQPNVSELVLDSNFLDIQSVLLDGVPLKFSVADHHPKFGSKFTIHFEKPLGAEEEVKVCIGYATTEKCTALQWLEPSQTMGKKYPYLFSQCQHVAMSGRAFHYIRTQDDTPGNKLKWSADVAVPSHLRALMSAVRTGERTVGDQKVYSFAQNVGVPSYLIALAVGNLEGRTIGPRSTVWSEPENVDAAAWEFIDTERFIKTGEELLTPYEWGLYDLLVLPPSFPSVSFFFRSLCSLALIYVAILFNRSLVDVVAHEIAHSWMGNLVTTQNWEHFWLNEGFTVFIERKIAGRLHGQPVLEFDAIIGLKALSESVEHFEEIKRPEFTRLCPCLRDEDPDEVSVERNPELCPFTHLVRIVSVSMNGYDSLRFHMGFNLLFYLERLLGGPDVFEPYLKAHVTKFAHTSIATDDFKRFLYEFYRTSYGDEKIALLDTVDWNAWLHEPGMPPVKNEFNQELAQVCQDLADEWDACRGKQPHFDKSVFEKFNSNQKVMFLEKCLLKSAFPHELLAAMDEIYALSSVTNAEIRFRQVVAMVVSECRVRDHLPRGHQFSHGSWENEVCAAVVPGFGQVQKRSSFGQENIPRKQDLLSSYLRKYDL
ncbi:leukotriene-A4 hydrolase [Spizellomyces sp. 'palustris']|nr:leukotriene-A4 hydrolase [Spizellomyces sp. 'palustris']